MRLLVLAATIAHTTRAARYALRVAYDGTHFNGWQHQPNARTVEGELRKAFTTRFDGVNVPLLGASRTDSGVHARGQAAHVDLPEVVADVDLLKHQLNRMLPDDVRINCVREAPPGGEKPWHALRVPGPAGEVVSGPRVLRGPGLCVAVKCTPKVPGPLRL